MPTSLILCLPSSQLSTESWSWLNEKNLIIREREESSYSWIAYIKGKGEKNITLCKGSMLQLGNTHRLLYCKFISHTLLWGVLPVFCHELSVQFVSKCEAHKNRHILYLQSLQPLLGGFCVDFPTTVTENK